MIKFIIYDDEKIFRSKLKDSINNTMHSSKEEYSIEEFEKYNNKMQKVINNNEPKIYILDIEVPGSLSGIDLARKIRQNDWNSIIILVTSHVDMGYEALKAQIMLLDFISKFNDCESNLNHTIKKALTKLETKKILIFENSEMTYKVHVDDIIYVVRDTIDRKSIIKTEYNEVIVNETITDIQNMLDKRFFLTHRSCLVNIDKVSKIDWKENIIYFTDGETIDYISKYKRKELKEYVRSW